MVIVRASLVIVLLAAAAKPAAELTWKIVSSTGKSRFIPQTLPTDFGMKDSEKTVSSQIRKAVLPLFGQAQRVSSAPQEKAQEDIPKTTLSLVLKGVIGASDMKMALAFINSKSGKDEDGIYALGDNVPGNAEVKEIYFDRVILLRSGKLETLLLEEEDDQGSPSVKTASVASAGAGVRNRGDGMHWDIDEQYFKGRLADIPSLAKEVGLDVYKEGGRQKGYKLVSAKGSSLLTSMGLKPGDALIEVNGISLIDAHRGLTAYQKIRDASEIRLVIERNGEKKDLVYSVN